jgi:hypothetical protein
VAGSRQLEQRAASKDKQLKVWEQPVVCSCEEQQLASPQKSNELTGGPSALSFIGRVRIGARALLDPKLIWFGYITRLSQWGRGGGYLLVQMISTCRQGLRGMGEGVGTLWTSLTPSVCCAEVSDLKAACDETKIRL